MKAKYMLHEWSCQTTLLHQLIAYQVTFFSIFFITPYYAGGEKSIIK